MERRGRKLDRRVIEQAQKMAKRIGIRPTARELRLGVNTVRRYLREAEKKKEVSDGET